MDSPGTTAKKVVTVSEKAPVVPEPVTDSIYGLVSRTIQPDGSTRPDPELSSPELKRTIWDQYIEIADSFNDPGTFTTLVGYEWSSQPNMSNLHRNVLFRSSNNLPVPFSYFDSNKPEDLWAWMDEQRVNLRLTL